MLTILVLGLLWHLSRKGSEVQGKTMIVLETDKYIIRSHKISIGIICADSK